jgi:DNA-binding SARP family transcriptional activator
MIAVRTLGGFSLLADGVEVAAPRTRKARALLAYLALNAGLAIPRERLVELFWPDDDPIAARNSLKTAIHGVRRCFRDAGIDPDSAVDVDKINVRWVGGSDVDALEFSALSDEDAADRRAALALYRGDFLPDDYEPWATVERERLAAKYERSLAASLNSDAQLAHRLLERDPYDERAYIALIEAELQAGHQLVASAIAQRARAAMDELGAAPSAKLESLLARVPKIAASERRLPFCGREDELGILQSAMNGERGVLVVVLGPAGIGKSALLERTVAEHRSDRIVLRVSGSAGDARPYGPWLALRDALDAGVDPQSDDVAASLLARIPSRAALIVDDAQYFNRESAVLLSRMAAELVERGDAVIVASRPEGRPQLRPLFASAGAVLELQHLSLSNVEVAVAAGGGDGAQARRLFERSGGHPLFLAQLFATPADERDGELPATFKHRIESLLSARGEDAVAVACALALEGDADVETLVAVLRLDEERVLDAFDDLLAAGIVREGSGQAWAFEHDAIAEVAAQMLSAPRRHVLHERFATELASRDEPEVSLRRARHLVAAGKRVEAARAYLASTEDAMELHAALAAIDRAEAGLEATQMLERSDGVHELRANLHIVQARAALELTDWAAGAEYASKAVRAAEQGHAQERLAYALYLRGGANHASWKMEAALVDYERAALLMDAPETARQRAIVGHEIAAARRILGDLDGAAREADTSYALLESRRHMDPNLVDAVGVNVRLCKAQALATAWQFEACERLFVETSHEAAHVGGACEIHWHQSHAEVLFVADRFEAADAELAIVEDLLDTAERERRSKSSHGPMFGHTRYSMTVLRATMAAARGEFDAVETFVAIAERMRVFEGAVVERRRLAMLRADALLRSGAGPGAFEVLLAAIPDENSVQDLNSFSTTPRLTHARLLVRLGDARAGAALDAAWEATARHAALTPLRCDDAFERLAEAAAEAGDETLAGRAREAAAGHRALRLALGGGPSTTA